MQEVQEEGEAMPMQQVGAEVAWDVESTERPRTQVGPLSTAGVIVNLVFPFAMLFPIMFLFKPKESAITLPMTLGVAAVTVLLGILPWVIVVPPKTHKLAVFWGTLARVYTEPGIYLLPMMGRKLTVIPTAVQTLEIHRSTVLDRNGNPIVVSGVVTFVITDSIRAAFDVINYRGYLENQAVAVLKRVCSKYPYECRTGKSLQSESEEVSRLLVRDLQEKADAAGGRVLSF